MAITLKRPAEIEKMRAANKIVARTLDHVSTIIKPGISLLEIDKICEDMIRAAGAKPAFKGLYGFPNAACISVNEVVIHGIPNEYKLKDGDIVSVDIGSNLDGYFGGTSVLIVVSVALDTMRRIEAQSYTNKYQTLSAVGL